MVEALELKTQPDLASRVQGIEEDGYAYFPGAMSADQVAELREVMAHLTPIEASFNRYSTPDNGGFLNKHINNVFNHDPIFLQYMDGAGVIDLAEAVHGDDCHIIGMTAWVTGPGRPDQHLHCDWLPVELPGDVLDDPRVKMPVFITTAHYYLNDMYEELGPTKFIPGSHKSGRRPMGDADWDGVTEKSVLCKAGDAVMFRCEVWHRGTSNRSDEDRYLLQVHYAKRMITQKFPPYLNKFQFDPDIIALCNPRQRRLLGDHTSSNYD